MIITVCRWCMQTSSNSLESSDLTFGWQKERYRIYTNKWSPEQIWIRVTLCLQVIIIVLCHSCLHYNSPCQSMQPREERFYCCLPTTITNTSSIHFLRDASYLSSPRHTTNYIDAIVYLFITLLGQNGPD